MQQEPDTAEPSLHAASHPYLTASLWVLTETGFKAYQGVQLVLPVKAWGLESQAKCLSLLKLLYLLPRHLVLAAGSLLRLLMQLTYWVLWTCWFSLLSGDGNSFPIPC